MIPDKFFPWPYPSADLTRPALELSYVLEKSDLAEWLVTPAGNLAEFMALVCREWDVNPWWLIVSAQREQSAIRRGDFSPSAAAAWLGFVGKDKGRAVLPGYYGIFTQIQRCAAQTSWLFGRRPDARKKDTPRFYNGIVMEVEDQGEKKKHRPGSAAEYTQLEYTPHMGVLPVNFRIASEIPLAARFL